MHCLALSTRIMGPALDPHLGHMGQTITYQQIGGWVLERQPNYSVVAHGRITSGMRSKSKESMVDLYVYL